MSAGIFKESLSAHSKHALYFSRCVSNCRVALKMPAPIAFVVVLHSLYLLASPRALFENARDHCARALVLYFVFLFIYPKGGQRFRGFSSRNSCRPVVSRVDHVSKWFCQKACSSWGHGENNTFRGGGAHFALCTGCRATRPPPHTQAPTLLATNRHRNSRGAM